MTHGAPRKALRFVVLRHEGYGPAHYDVMFESAERPHRLITFRCDEWPISAGASVELIQIADHRRAYLTFEGPLSGGRGIVKRVDEGAYRPAEGSVGAADGTAFTVRLFSGQHGQTVLAATRLSLVGRTWRASPIT